MHGMYGEVEDPDGNDMHRVCYKFATKKAQSSLHVSNPPKRKEADGGFLAPGHRSGSVLGGARGAGEIAEALRKDVNDELVEKINVKTTTTPTRAVSSTYIEDTLPLRRRARDRDRDR